MLILDLEVENLNILPILYYLIEGSVLLAFFLVPGIVISALIAIIPFRDRRYIEKFYRILPVTLSVVLVMFNIVWGILAMQLLQSGRRSGPVRKYSNIKLAKDLDCSSVHEGKFEADDFSIDRKGGIQIESMKEDGIEDTLRIQWINDCEYVLKKDSKEVLRCKITSVTDQGYQCQVLYASSKLGYASEFTLNRQEQD